MENKDLDLRNANVEFDEFDSTPSKETTPVEDNSKKSDKSDSKKDDPKKDSSKSSSKKENKVNSKESKPADSEEASSQVNAEECEAEVINGTNDYKPVPKGWLIFAPAVSVKGEIDKNLIQQVTDKTVCMVYDNRIVQFNLETGEERGSSKIGLALAESTLKVLRCNIKYNSKIHKKLVESQSAQVLEIVKMAKAHLVLPSVSDDEIDITKKLIVSPSNKESKVPKNLNKVISDHKTNIVMDAEGNPITKDGKKMRPLNELLDDLKKRYDESDDEAEKAELEEKIANLEEKKENSRQNALKREELTREVVKAHEDAEFEDNFDNGEFEDEFSDKGDDFEDF